MASTHPAARRDAAGARHGQPHASKSKAATAAAHASAFEMRMGSGMVNLALHAFEADRNRDVVAQHAGELGGADAKIGALEHEVALKAGALFALGELSLVAPL